MEINFVGEFKKLKTIGYKYLKLHSSNQIYYRKEDVLIWKKGKDVEVADLYSTSYLLLQYLIDNDFKINDKFNTIIINTETKQIELYDRFKHEPLHFGNKLSDEEVRKLLATYRKHRISDATVAVVKELYDLNLININS